MPPLPPETDSAAGAPAAARVLVTGANGFVGSSLCRHLARRPGVEVVGLVRRGSDLTLLSGECAPRLVRGDIEDPASVARAAQGVLTVYHVAGLAADWGSWRAFRTANVEGVRNVLEAARHEGVRRLVHVSSVSAYGFPGGLELDEATPFAARPRDRYVTTKAAGDRIAMAANGRGLEIVIVRPGGIYGPGDRVTTRPLADALRKGRFGYVDGGRHMLAPIYIGNLVELMRLAGERAEAAGEAFNAVDDGHTRWRQYIEWFCEDLGCPPPRLSLPAAIAWPLAVAAEDCARALGARSSPPINTYRLRATMQDNHYSADKAKRLLGWTPSVTTRDGLRRAARWYLRVAATAPGEAHAS